MKVLAKVKFNKSIAMILDKQPELTYVRYKGCLIGSSDDGQFWDVLAYSTTSGKTAFGGNAFTLRMKDGTEFTCDGYWWDAGYGTLEEFVGEKTVNVTARDIESLKRCYVFASYTMRVGDLERLLETCDSEPMEYRVGEAWVKKGV